MTAIIITQRSFRCFLLIVVFLLLATIIELRWWGSKESFRVQSRAEKTAAAPALRNSSSSPHENGPYYDDGSSTHMMVVNKGSSISSTQINQSHAASSTAAEKGANKDRSRNNRKSIFNELTMAADSLPGFLKKNASSRINGGDDILEQDDENNRDNGDDDGGGVIILNLLGRLANNLFEVSFANRLAQQLNWKVVYRPLWQGVFPDQPRASFCFPHVMQPLLLDDKKTTASITPQPRWKDLPRSIRNHDVFRNLTTPLFWNSLSRRDSSKAYVAWSEKLEQQTNISMTLVHTKFHFLQSESFTHDLVQRLSNSNSSSTVRLLHLQAFFIHYDWMQDWIPQINRWTRINPECCRTTVVPDNAVVLHWRDFSAEDPDHPMAKIDMVPVFYDILEHYNYLPYHQQQQQEQQQQQQNGSSVEARRPIFIVCQPSSLQQVGLRRLVRAIESNLRNPNKSSTSKSVLRNKVNNVTSSSLIHVVTGHDEMDAMCILRKSRILLLTSSSTFSQFPAIFRDVGGDTTDSNNDDDSTTNNVNVATASTTRQIHYPLLRLIRSPVTLKVPHWHYHLVNQTKNGDGIEQFDIEHDQFEVKDD